MVSVGTPPLVSLVSGRAGGESSSEFFSFNFASNPSTRRRSASNTSPLGPRFLGVASTDVVSANDLVLIPATLPTVYARALKHLACFTGWPETIAFDLQECRCWLVDFPPLHLVLDDSPSASDKICSSSTLGAHCLVVSSGVFLCLPVVSGWPQAGLEDPGERSCGW